MTRALLLFVAVPSVTLTMMVGECDLEYASIWPVPPTTFKMIEVLRCGVIECVRRSVIVDGAARRETQVCGSGDRLAPVPAMPTGSP